MWHGPSVVRLAKSGRGIARPFHQDHILSDPTWSPRAFLAAGSRGVGEGGLIVVRGREGHIEWPDSIMMVGALLRKPKL